MEISPEPWSLDNSTGDCSVAVVRGADGIIVATFPSVDDAKYVLEILSKQPKK